jgi:hypothetical protein
LSETTVVACQQHNRFLLFSSHLGTCICKGTPD